MVRTDVSVITVVFLLDAGVTETRLSDAQSQSTGVDGLMAPEKEEGEDWLGDQVKDTIEDGLGIRVDNIATLGNAPCDGIEEPDENGQHAANVVGA
jgi:hypothetical protein